MKKINSKKFFIGRTLCLCVLATLSTHVNAAVETSTAPNTKTTCNNNAKTTSSAYIDCVYNWGPWALDVEPAAGGPQPVTQPITAHSSRVRLRTDSTAAIAPVVPAAITQRPINTAPPSTNTRPYQPGEPSVTGTPRSAPVVTPAPVNTAPPSANTTPYQQGGSIARGTPRS